MIFRKSFLIATALCSIYVLPVFGQGTVTSLTGVTLGTGPNQAIANSRINAGNGVAGLSSDGSASALLVVPTGSSGFRSLADVAAGALTGGGGVSLGTTPGTAIDNARINAANGVAGTGSDSKVLVANLPLISLLSGYVDPTNASNLSSGTVSAVRLPAISALTGYVDPTNGSNIATGTIAAARLPSISALTGYVDPTNASNIASGTLNIARLPALTTSTISEGSNLYFTNARVIAAAPVQSVATLTGAPTAAQIVAQLGGTTSSTLAFGNDSRIVGAVQASSIGAASGVAGTDSAGCVLYSSAVRSCVVSGVLEFLTIP